MMNWITNSWTTIGEAVGVKRFAIDGAIGIVALAVQYFASKWPHWPLRDIPSWLIAAIVIVLILSFWVLNYATKLRREKIPKIELVDLYNFGDAAEKSIRVVVRNSSLADIDGLKARLVNITDSANAFLKGEQLAALKAEKEPIEFPIKLFTQERIKETKVTGKHLSKPFDLASGEKRAIEVFQLKSYIGFFAYIREYSRSSTQITTPPDMKFHCEIHGGGAPIEFFVQYNTQTIGDKRKHSVELFYNDGRSVAKREWQRSIAT